MSDSYTYENIKADRMYVLYANASYYSTVCMAVESINNVSDIPVIVYMLNDYREVPGATAIYWECDIEDVAKGAYIDRNDSRIYNLLIQRASITKDALLNYANTIVYVDSDIVVTPYIDTVFDMYDVTTPYPYITEGVYEYVLSNGRGGADSKEDLSTTLEHPSCELFNVNQYVRQAYRTTNIYIAGQASLPFIEEWEHMCNNPLVMKEHTWYAPFHEETLINVLLWKYNYLNGLPYIYVNGGLKEMDEVNRLGFTGEKQYIREWFVIPEKKEHLLAFHGEKDPVQMSKLMSKISKPMSKLKILFLAPHLSTGGMPAFLLKRIQALQTLPNVSIQVVEYQCYSKDYVVQRDEIIKLTGLYTLNEDKMRIFKAVEEFKPDIIHIDEMSERLDRKMMTRLYSPDRKYKIVETCHDVSFNPSEKIFTPDAYAFCTPYHLDTFKDVDGYKQVIEFPIDKQIVSPKDKLFSKAYLGMDSRKKHVVNVGLWTKGKNQGEGIEIARSLPYIEFHFVGNQAGNFEDYWKPLMKNIPDNVTVWGERDDIDRFMKAADAFMFNSTWECNPLALREAIGYGLPILARNLPQYKDMFVRYITNINEDPKTQLETILNYGWTYDTPFNNTTDDFAKDHISVYEKAMSVIPNKKPINDYNIVQNFVGQPFLEITGTSDSTFDVEFHDFETQKLVHYDTIKCNHWIKLNREYFTRWQTIVYKDGVEVYNNILNLENRRVYIAFDSSSLGDTIAWMPYIEEFRCLHNCEVIISTFKNFLFEKEYPMLEFVEPGTTVNNLHAMYKLGWFYNDNKEPVLPNTVPLQQTATNILGLEYKEIRPSVHNSGIKANYKLVTIATNSTAGCKFWTREAWQEVINYLHDQGYRVKNVSLENNPFDNCDALLDKSIESTIEWIAQSKFFIGLSSGLSWLAWGLDVPVIMISNFTDKDHEFSCHRPVNTNVCHGCWNKAEYKFDKGDWDWCPVHKGTERQFECQKSVTPNMVIEIIKTLL
jgi:autotransporter strand-loop-strand O-heptosyltransferase